MSNIFKSKKIILLILVLTLTTFLVTGIATLLLYRTSVELLKTSLVELAEDEKSLIETLHSSSISKDSIIQILQASHITQKQGIEKTRELVIVESVNEDTVNFILEQKITGNTINVKRPLNQGFAIPVRMSLQAVTGSVVGLDYKGSEVIAGVSYVASLKWGIVAKIQSSEFYQPFLKVLFIISGIALVFIFFGTYLFVKITDPIFKSIFQEKERLSITIQSIGDAVIATDTEGRITLMNYLAEELTGWSEPEAMGKLLTEVFHIINEQTRLICENPVEVVLKTGKIVELANHTAIISRNGKERIIADSGSPIRDDNGNIFGVILVFRDETEKHIAQQAFKENRYRLKEAQKIAKLGIYELDVTTGVWTSSDILNEIFGIGENYPRNVQSWSDIVHPKWREEMDQYFAGLILNKTRFDKEYKIIRQNDNAERWVWGQGELFFDENGNVVRMLGSIQDITERKNSEEELRQNKARLLKGEKIAKTGNWEYHVDSGLIIASEGAKNIYGLKGEKFSIEQARAARLEEYNVFVDNAMSNLIATGEPYDIEFKIKQAGTSAILDIHSISEYNKESKTIFGVIQDITERKKAAEELQESHNFNSALLQAIPFGMQIVDENGNILFISKYFEGIFGTECLGVKCWKLYRDDKLQCDECPLHQGVIEGVMRMEAQGVMGGKTFEVIHTGMIFKGLNAMLEIFIDITERKQAEEALRIAKEKAEISERLKSSFLANMSHELRTPLNGILGFSELVAHSHDLKDAQEMGSFIHDSGERLLDTLNLILDLSRIEAGESQLEPSEFDLIEEATDVLNLFSASAEKKHLSLTLSSQLEKLSVFTSRKAIESILNNLVNNAIKFTEIGKISLSITKEILNSKEMAVIKITDTGIGIAEKDFDHIFENFRQASEGLSRSHDGTGLGLSLSKKYIEMLDGTISLESTIGIGTTFTLNLPTNYHLVEMINEVPETIENEVVSEVANIPTTAKMSGIKKVLIVENDATSLLLVKTLLQNICELDTATTANEAIEKAYLNQYAIILMDINLGRSKNGMYATKEIRTFANYQDTPIIAMTAYAMKEDREEFLSGGCTDYISKPFEIDGFLAMVSKYLS